MRKYAIRLVLLTLLAAVIPTRPSQATTGHVRVEFLKAGLIVGGGFGRGVLTYHGRDYRFRISGLSFGLTAGASTLRLGGQASHLHQLSDFAGTYSAVGVGGAWVAGAGGVQLKNDKGVTMTLQSNTMGLEIAANLTGIKTNLHNRQIETRVADQSAIERPKLRFLKPRSLRHPKSYLPEMNRSYAATASLMPTQIQLSTHFCES